MNWTISNVLQEMENISKTDYKENEFTVQETSKLYKGHSQGVRPSCPLLYQQHSHCFQWEHGPACSGGVRGS